MKKMLVLFLSLIMLLSLFSCKANITLESNPSSTESPTTFDTASEPKENTPKMDLSSWKSTYLNIIESRPEFDSTYDAYALVYVDADDIPELYVLGSCEAEGDIIYSYKNGNIFEQRLARMAGGKYIERSGKIINQNGHMGGYYDYVYVLDNSGFTQTLNAVYTERYEDTGNGDFSVNIIREYFINGESVSENDYNYAINSSFDFSQSIEFYEKSVSYGEIKQQLS